MAHWFWSHDIQPHQIDGLATPGFRLMRLSDYGGRFAAVFHAGPGPARTHALALTAALLAGTPGRPVAVTVDTTRAEPLFSLVLESGSGATVHAGLDDAGLHALLDGTRQILDLDTYPVGGQRRYVAVVADSPVPSLLFTGVTRRQLTSALREQHAVPVLVRPVGGDVFTAVATSSGPDERRAWHTDLDGDGVARELDRGGAYPADLDATRTARGVRFTVVVGMARGGTRP